MAEKTKKLNDTTMITIRNNSGGGVYFKNDMGILRAWEKPNSVKKLTLLELTQAMSQYGVYKMFEKGLLIIEDNNIGEIREMLGLPELDEYILTLDEVKELLKSKDYDDLKNVLKWSNKFQKDTIIQTAISEKVSDANVINIIKEITGQDITSLIIDDKDNKAETKKEVNSEETRPPRKKK